MKKIGVTGYKGKLGSLLMEKPNFVCMDVDITSIESLSKWKSSSNENIDVIVNCAAMSSVDECELNYKRALEINYHGLMNLHRIFGNRILNISSDQVFNGRSWVLPKENTIPDPINNYGYSKLGGETVSSFYGGKTIRLSRTISTKDLDMKNYAYNILKGDEIEVPSFISRGYLHREYAANGIEYMARNWDNIKENLVNYAGMDSVTTYGLTRLMALNMNRISSPIKKRTKMHSDLAPRPRKGGLNVNLAGRLGFPMYSISDSVSKLCEEIQ